MHRIVVLGAGYTGMIAAIRVARRTRRRGTQVTLVNPSDRFTERLRMHQTATGQTLPDRSIPDLLQGTGIEFVRARAERIDIQRREVSAGGRAIGYDTLVYAIGSVAETAAVPGVAAHAYTLDTVESAGRLAAVLAGKPDATVVVVGGGLTGVEAATEIAERHPAAGVVLLGRDAPGPLMSARARAHLDRALRRLGVQVRTGVEVVAVRGGGVELAGGEFVAADATLWTTGFTAAPLAGEAGLTIDERGRIVVDATLRSVSHPYVVAIGDAAAIRQPWGVIHGTCQSGLPSAAHAADGIARVLAGKRALPFRFGYFHQPVSLGRKDAVIQFTRADDTPRRWCLTGLPAVLYKELVTSSPVPAFRLSKRLNVPVALSRG